MEKVNVNTVTDLPCTIQLPDGYELTGRVDLETYELEDDFNLMRDDLYNIKNLDFRAKAQFRKNENGVLFTVTKKKPIRQIKVEHRVMGPVDFTVIRDAYDEVQAPHSASIEIVDGGGQPGRKCIIFRWDE